MGSMARAETCSRPPAKPARCAKPAWFARASGTECRVKAVTESLGAFFAARRATHRPSARKRTRSGERPLRQRRATCPSNPRFQASMAIALGHCPFGRSWLSFRPLLRVRPAGDANGSQQKQPYDKKRKNSAYYHFHHLLQRFVNLTTVITKVDITRDPHAARRQETGWTRAGRGGR